MRFALASIALTTIIVTLATSPAHAAPVAAVVVDQDNARLQRAENLMRRIYDDYIAHVDEGGAGNFTDRPLSNLLRALWSSAPEVMPGTPLDGDPIIDGNDYDLRTVSLHSTVIDRERVRVEADFLHNGERKHVVIDIIEERGAPRIDNISTRNSDLRKTLRMKIEQR